MKATVVQILDAVSALQEIAKQPMGLVEAEKVSDFNEKLQPILEEIEAERRSIVASWERAKDEGGENDDVDADANEAFKALADREFEIPQISFSQYPSIKISPAQVTFLKRLKVF